MANLRTIKKDIDFLLTEVISDCWTFMYVNNGQKEDLAVDIINAAVDLRNNMYIRVNHYDKTNAKKEFKAINMDLLKSVDELFVRISKLIDNK
jgi:hypothetical protein